MRFAIFSDIHANLQAWEAVLADIQSQGVDTLVCLGDVVGYGPMPGPVLESVYQHTDNFVLGNHDAVVGGRIDAATFNAHARYVIEWTAQQLGDDGAAFFAQVPLTLRGEKMLFTHGDVARPGHFNYVVRAEDARPSFQACKDETIFFGHTHEPGVFACATNKGIIDKLPAVDVVLKKGRRYMINPGSVGDPREASDLRASYCFYDDSTRLLSFRRVGFDVEAYRADLAASGLQMMPYFLRAIDAGSRRPEEDEELAMVQDHLEAVDMDDSLAVQPRALVTIESPLANRSKLHFGFLHPQGYPYPGAPQQPYPQGGAPPDANPLQAPQVHLMPSPSKDGRNMLAVMIVGVLIGIAAIILVISHFSESPGLRLGDVGDTAQAAGRPGGLLSDEGWEDAGETTKIRRSAVAPGPAFSLSSLVDRPYEKYQAKVPEGVVLESRQMGGQLLRFGAGAGHVEIPEVDAANIRGSITVVAWIKISPVAHERLIFARGTEEPLPVFFRVTSRGDEKPGCVVFGGGGLSPGAVRSASGNRIDDGEWHLVAGTYDAELGRLRAYVDGEISKDLTCTGGFAKMGGAMLLGGGVTGYGGFEGEIYGLRIFSWGLRPHDMKKIYDLGE